MLFPFSLREDAQIALYQAISDYTQCPSPQTSPLFWGLYYYSIYTLTHRVPFATHKRQKISSPKFHFDCRWLLGGGSIVVDGELRGRTAGRLKSDNNSRSHLLIQSILFYSTSIISTQLPLVYR